MQEGTIHEGVQRALSSPLSTSGNGSLSPLPKANSAGVPLFRPLHPSLCFCPCLFVVCVTAEIPQQGGDQQLALRIWSGCEAWVLHLNAWCTSAAHCDKDLSALVLVLFRHGGHLLDRA